MRQSVLVLGTRSKTRTRRPIRSVSKCQVSRGAPSNAGMIRLESRVDTECVLGLQVFATLDSRRIMPAFENRCSLHQMEHRRTPA